MRSVRNSKSCRKSTLWGLVRAFSLGLLVLAVTIALSLRKAEARLGESLIAFGDQLSAWTGGKLDSKVGHLSVNGLLMHRVTASTSLGVEDALNRFSSVCSMLGGIDGAEKLLSEKSAPMSPATRNLLSGTYRHESGLEGVLACIDSGHPLDVKELPGRLQEFAKTGDLSSVGRLRYVLARRDGNVTSLLVLWTDGSASLLKMFPSSGDAPGRDAPDVPRPQNTDRLLSASDLGAPYSITVYRSHSSSSGTLPDGYVKALKDRGWHVIESKAGSLVARRGARTLLVRTTRVTSGSTTTSIVELS